MILEVVNTICFNTSEFFRQKVEDYRASDSQWLLPGFPDLMLCVFIEDKCIECLQNKPCGIDCLQGLVLDELAIVEANTAHADTGKEG